MSYLRAPRYSIMASVALGVIFSGLAFAVPAQAAPAQGDPSPLAGKVHSPTADQTAQAARFEAAYKRALPALTLSPAGVLVFDAERATRLGVPTEFISDLATGIVASGGQSTGGRIDGEALARFASVTSTAARCAGVNGAKTFWYGKQTLLNNCLTQGLIGVLGGAASFAGIVAVLAAAGIVTASAALPAGLVAGILGLGVAALSVCNMYGRGVAINTTWAGAGWCWGQ
jgi:hypothetical protein